MNLEFFDSKDWLIHCGDSTGAKSSIGRIYIIQNEDVIPILILDSWREIKDHLYVF